MSIAKAVLQSTRGPFLLLSPICVFLAFSAAYFSNADINYGHLLLALLGALSANISVNALNEYLDFESGLDLVTQRTPFSGGSGALPSCPSAATSVLLLGGASLILVVLIGLYFIWSCGLTILPIGLVGIAVIAAYTRIINRRPLLCLVAPGLGFGVLMVLGSYFVMVEGFSPLAALVCLVPFFLVNNLLLLNQYPDIDADKSVGRAHFPISFGIHNSNVAYALFAFAAAMAIIVGIVFKVLPLISAIALLPMGASAAVWFAMVLHRQNIGNYPGYMAMNVFVCLVTPLSLGVSLLLA